MAHKICKLCGIPKKITFTCKRCKKIACLDCYDFITSRCADCDVITYNEKYKSNLEAYRKGVAQ